MLTDVVLQAGSEQFHAHKLVLASASPYFKVCPIFSCIFVYYILIIYNLFIFFLSFSGYVYRRLERV